jgi:hypothetical protein
VPVWVYVLLHGERQITLMTNIRVKHTEHVAKAHTRSAREVHLVGECRRHDEVQQIPPPRLHWTDKVALRGPWTSCYRSAAICHIARPIACLVAVCAAATICCFHAARRFYWRKRMRSSLSHITTLWNIAKPYPARCRLVPSQVHSTGVN